MNHRLGYLLIGLILLIEVPRFFGAYDGIDPRLFSLPLTALGTGIVLPLGAGYVLHTWWTVPWNKKGRDMLAVWFAALLLMEGVILIPWGMSRLQNEALSVVVGSGLVAWLWVSVVMLSPFVCVGGLVTAISLKKQPEQKRGALQKPAKQEDAMHAQLHVLPVSVTHSMTKRERVQQLAELHPDWTRARLAQEAGCSESTVSRALT
uniref:Uncharacterized protein n=1 Tax=viral metagenome TaxID=1070528 RepID=A0A6M3LJF7_9ZZZZ